MDPRTLARGASHVRSGRSHVKFLCPWMVIRGNAYLGSPISDAKTKETIVKSGKEICSL